MGAFATQLSMFGFIPSWPDVYLEVMALVQTPDGKTFSYEIKDGLVQINFLPLIIVAPFKPATSDYNEVVRNLYRTLFHKMQDDGVLPREKPMVSSNITDVTKRQAETTSQQSNKNL